MKMFLGRATLTVAAMSTLLLLLPVSEVQAGGGTEKDMPKRLQPMSPGIVFEEAITNVVSQGNDKKTKEEPIADQPMQKKKDDDIPEDIKNQRIGEIMVYGLTREEAKKALEINTWDFEKALEYILDHPLDIIKQETEEPIEDQTMQKGKDDDIPEDVKNHRIKEIVTHGWEREEAKEALEINGWDFDDALDYLLDKPLEEILLREKEEDIKVVAQLPWDDMDLDSEDDEVPEEELIKREVIAQFAVLLEEEGYKFNDALLALSQAGGNIERARQYLEEDKNEVRHEVNHGVHHNARGAPAAVEQGPGIDMTHLKDFLAMGFEEQEIVKALTDCNGNFECAYDRLVG